MERYTISQVSKACDISTRMLRYYEQVGLIQSFRNEDNAYRLYDEAALKRIQQIIILRKLQIPVKQICIIMNTPDAAEVIEIFKTSVSNLDAEMTALSTIKSVLDKFVRELEKLADLQLNLDFLRDDAVLQLTGSLSLVQRNVKDGPTMTDLNKASEVVNRLRNVRVVYLPPMTVASAFFEGENAQERAWQAINGFVRHHNLIDIKPDLRLFRIEHANATGKNFGNEVWASIPDDYPVPPPLTKKRFHGGQYAAHVLGDDGFLTYLGLQDWINESDRYQYDYDGNLKRCDPPIEEIDSFGGVRLDPEEILNYPEVFRDPGADIQYDVFFPIRKYLKTDDAPVEVSGSIEKCGFKAHIVTKGKFRIMGFTKIMTPESGGPEQFEAELKTDGRLWMLNKYKKPGAPILVFGSHDMDSQMRGGWRSSFCLMESDIMDVQAFTRYRPYIRTIDAAKWLVFELGRADAFDGHSICMKLGYTWNGTISGSFMVYPDGRIGKSAPGGEEEKNDAVYCWYPVK